MGLGTCIHTGSYTLSYSYTHTGFHTPYRIIHGVCQASQEGESERVREGESEGGGGRRREGVGGKEGGREGGGGKEEGREGGGGKEEGGGDSVNALGTLNYVQLQDLFFPLNGDNMLTPLTTPHKHTQLPRSVVDHTMAYHGM